MKKIIIPFFAIFALLFTGCFSDSDTATVRINLGNKSATKAIGFSKVAMPEGIGVFLVEITGSHMEPKHIIYSIGEAINTITNDPFIEPIYGENDSIVAVKITDAETGEINIIEVVTLNISLGENVALEIPEVPAGNVTIEIRAVQDVGGGTHVSYVDTYGFSITKRLYAGVNNIDAYMLPIPYNITANYQPGYNPVPVPPTGDTFGNFGIFWQIEGDFVSEYYDFEIRYTAEDGTLQILKTSDLKALQEKFPETNFFGPPQGGVYNCYINDDNINHTISGGDNYFINLKRPAPSGFIEIRVKLSAAKNTLGKDLYGVWSDEEYYSQTGTTQP